MTYKKEFRAHSDRAYRLEFLQKKKQVLSIGVDKIINLYDPETQKSIAKFKSFYTFDFDSSFAVSKNNRYFVGIIEGKGNRNLTLVRFSDRFPGRFSFFSQEKKYCHACTIGPITMKCVKGSTSGELEIFNPATLKRCFYLRNEHEGKRINTLRYDNRERFLFSGGSNKTVCVFNAFKRYSVVYRFEFPVEVINVNVSNDNKWMCFGGFIYSANKNKHIHLVEIEKIMELAKNKPKKEDVSVKDEKSEEKKKETG